MYDKACTDDFDDEIKLATAHSIYEEYLSEEPKANFYVELDNSVRYMFDMKFRQIEDNLNEYLFIEVYAYVLDKLRKYFNMFKNSHAF
jgi:hypothetical protein